MNKLVAPALLLFVLLLGALAVQTQPVAAQAGPTWQYRVFRLDPSEYESKLDYKQLLEREGPRKVEGVFFERVLDHLGGEGWELVQVERRGRANLTYLYLKRPAR